MRKYKKKERLKKSDKSSERKEVQNTIVMTENKENEDADRESRREKRTGIILVVLAFAGTFCYTGIKLSARIVNVWPNGAMLFFIAEWVTCLGVVSAGIVIFIDIIAYIICDLKRCNILDVNYKRFDSMVDKKYQKLIDDFEASFIIVLASCLGFVIVSSYFEKGITVLVLDSIILVILLFAYFYKQLKLNKRCLTDILLDIGAFLYKLTIVGLIVFAFALALIDHVSGRLEASYGKDGIIEIKNEANDTLDDIYYAVLDNESKKILYQYSISTEEMMLAKENLTVNVDFKNGVNVSNIKISEEELYAKAKIVLNGIDLAQGTYIFEIKTGSKHRSVYFYNTFYFDGFSYTYSNETMEKSY